MQCTFGKVGLLEREGRKGTERVCREEFPADKIFFMGSLLGSAGIVLLIPRQNRKLSNGS